MLLKVDAAQLEWRVKVFLAQDKVGMAEIPLMDEGKLDIHTDNQNRFALPNRTIAKNYIYQFIFQDAFGDQGFYAAAAGFAHKADFQHVFGDLPKKRRVEKWLEVVESTFKKYDGIYKHGISLIREATTTGRIVVPSGRFYPFVPEPTYGGDLDWPRTKILNYPVQGFSADLVQVARLTIWKRIQALPAFEKGQILLINTVHDDVEVDVDNDPELVYTISTILEQSFRDIPSEFKKLYGSEINVPLAGEVKYGLTLNESDMKKFKKATFEQDWKEYLEKHGK